MNRLRHAKEASRRFRRSGLRPDAGSCRCGFQVGTWQSQETTGLARDSVEVDKADDIEEIAVLAGSCVGLMCS